MFLFSPAPWLLVMSRRWRARLPSGLAGTAGKAGRPAPRRLAMGEAIVLMMYFPAFLVGGMMVAAVVASGATIVAAFAAEVWHRLSAVFTAQ